MYGLVNKAIQELVVSRGGEETWEAVRRAAGADADGFIGMDPYPDEQTYALAGEAAERLGVPLEAFLEELGEFWMKYTAEEGYGHMLSMNGSTLEEFLSNVDAMHTRVAFVFPELRPPSFTVERTEDGVLRLHYYSEREGLSPMVVGLVRGVAARFDVEVESEWVARREDGHDHDVLELRRVA